MKVNKLKCDYLYVGRDATFATRKLSADDITAGSAGTAGTFISEPATDAKGRLILKAVDNTGNNDVTISNAAVEQTCVISIPDPGAATADFLLTTAAKNDKSVVTSTAAELNILDGVTSTAAELNQLDATGKGVSAGGSTLAVTQALHANRTIELDQTAGCVCTLPEATGTQDVYTFMVTIAATSNAYKIIAVDTTNTDLVGWVNMHDADTAEVWEVYASIQSDGNDYVQLNRTTTGGMPDGIGFDRLVFTDIKTDVWHVRGELYIAAGTDAATPFAST